MKKIERKVSDEGEDYRQGIREYISYLNRMIRGNQSQERRSIMFDKIFFASEVRRYKGLRDMLYGIFPELKGEEK